MLAILQYIRNRSHTLRSLSSPPTTSIIDNPPSKYLKEELSITVTRRHQAFPELIQLNNDSSVSPIDSAAANECCGLVLRETKEDWEVVCYPFDKMFHFHGTDKDLDTLPLEGFQWGEAKLFEQPIGVSMYLFHYEGSWLLSSSQNNVFLRNLKERIVAHTSITDAEFQSQLDALFWTWWHRLRYSLPEDKTLCYMFRFYVEPFPAFPFVATSANQREEELEKDDQQHKAYILLTGVRDQQSFLELWPSAIAERYGWQCVKERPDIYKAALDESDPSSDVATPSIGFVKKTLRALLEVSRDVSLLDSSGFVLCDPAFKKIVLHSPQYQDLYRLRRFTNR